jgi:hypothetical protein
MAMHGMCPSRSHEVPRAENRRAAPRKVWLTPPAGPPYGLIAILTTDPSARSAFGVVTIVAPSDSPSAISIVEP